MTLVVPLSSRAATDPEAAGGKAAALAVLTARGLPVPSGFVVTTGVLRGLLTDGASAIGAAELPAHVRRTALPPATARAIEAAASALGSGRLAVRSSAVGEDSTHASAAGQLDSFLGVAPAEVCSHVSRVLASGLDARFTEYRARTIGGEAAASRPAAVAVLVQRQVEARWAGVLYTFDPRTRSADRLIVEYTAGLGDRVAAGDVRPERLEISRKTVAIDEALDPALRAGLETLVRHALDIERALGLPADIEWAIDDERTWILQARPITGLLGPRTRMWSSTNLVENFPRPLTPFAAAFTAWFYGAYMRTWLRAVGLASQGDTRLDPLTERLIGFHGGRAYYDLDSWYALHASLPGGALLRPVFDRYVGQSVALRPNAPAAARVRRGMFPAVIAGARMAAVVLANHLRLDAGLDRLESALHRARRAWREPAATPKTLGDAVERLRAVHAFVGAHWRPAATADAAAMTASSITGALADRWLGPSARTLLPTILGGTKPASVEPAEIIARVAAAVSAEPGLAARLRARDALTADDFPPATRADILTFFDRFGARCYHESTIASPTFEESPQLFFDLVLRYAEGARRSDPLASGAADREALERALGALPALRRRVFRWAMGQARRGLAARERGRLARSLLFGEVRRAILAVGRALVDQGHLVRVDDVLFLLPAEIEALAGGRLPYPESLPPVVKARRDAHLASDGLELPEFFLGEPGEGPPRLPTPTAAAVTSAGLRGLGVSRGRVEGVVRVVRDPRQTALAAGEILVAFATDPGWTPLIALSGGFVVERGGLLSHVSIIARELGVPGIVGVEGVMQRLHDGQRVRLDGGAGTIHLLDLESERP